MFGNLGTTFNSRKDQSQNLNQINLKFMSDIMIKSKEGLFLDL